MTSSNENSRPKRKHWLPIEQESVSSRGLDFKITEAGLYLPVGKSPEPPPEEPVTRHLFMGNPKYNVKFKNIKLDPMFGTKIRAK